MYPSPGTRHEARTFSGPGRQASGLRLRATLKASETEHRYCFQRCLRANYHVDGIITNRDAPLETFGNWNSLVTGFSGNWGSFFGKTGFLWYQVFFFFVTGHVCKQASITSLSFQR